MDQIRSQMEAGRYDVDPRKVADAIVERLKVGRSVKSS
jgi:anti-sigma28 factor (negative regulator of flagellin synthesis)